MRTLLIASIWFVSISLVQAQDIFEISRSGSASAAKSLIRDTPEVINLKNSDGYSPLILATYHSNREVVGVLLDHNVEINERSGYGTALMAATVKGDKALVNLLLAHKADPNIADANGTTALLYAVMFRQMEIAIVLLEHQADPTLKDQRGNSAADYASMMKNNTLINLIKKHS